MFALEAFAQQAQGPQDPDDGPRRGTVEDLVGFMSMTRGGVVHGD